MIGTSASVDKRRAAAKLARQHDRVMAVAIVYHCQATAKPSGVSAILATAKRFVGNHR